MANKHNKPTNAELKLAKVINDNANIIGRFWSNGDGEGSGFMTLVVGILRGKGISAKSSLYDSQSEIISDKSE